MGNATISQAGKKRASRPLAEVEHVHDVPAFADDDEAAEFWDTHGPGEAFLDEAETGAPEWASPPRTRPVAIRFDADTLARLKAVAKTKHKGYQTLLKEFVAERLYEEEKREGIIPPTGPATQRRRP